MLLKKIGVTGYLRGRIELYENILSNFDPTARLRDVNSDPSDLHTTGLNLQDETVKHSYYLHYDRWCNILQHSRDPRIPALKRELKLLGLNNHFLFPRYIAVLFIHLSNVHHNMPPDINWEDETAVVNALSDWHINDVLELNSCRILYRMPNLT